MQQGVKRLRPDEITRVFIGGLSYSTDMQGLKDHFQQIGDVEFASVLMKPDGTSKGCGMINYRTHEEAATAVAQLNESVLDGRHIMVKLDVGGDFSKRPPTQGAQGPGAGNIADLAAQLLKQLGGAGGSGFQGFVPPQQEGVRLPPEQISRIFVGNLSFTTNWQALKDHFKAAGTVEFASVLETPDGVSKGVGLVNFMTHEEAMNAVAMLNESELDGRRITVKLDVDGRFKERPPPKSQQSPEERMMRTLQQQAAQQAYQEQRQQDASYYTMPADQISRVFVGNLAYQTNWQALKDHFSQVAEVDFASVLLNHDRTSKGCGMVNFKTHDDAMKAVELLNNSMLDGRQISVKLDVDGHFKERPPPGARPRVHQRTKEESMMGLSQGGGNQLLESMSSLVQVLQAPQTNTVDALAALGRLASQDNLAGQIDWPMLISTLAQAVSGQPQGGHTGQSRSYYGRH